MSKHKCFFRVVRPGYGPGFNFILMGCRPRRGNLNGGCGETRLLRRSSLMGK